MISATSSNRVELVKEPSSKTRSKDSTKRKPSFRTHGYRFANLLVAAYKWTLGQTCTSIHRQRQQTGRKNQRGHWVVSPKGSSLTFRAVLLSSQSAGPPSFLEIDCKCKGQTRHGRVQMAIQIVTSKTKEMVREQEPTSLQPQVFRHTPVPPTWEWWFLGLVIHVKKCCFQDQTSFHLSMAQETTSKSSVEARGPRFLIAQGKQYLSEAYSKWVRVRYWRSVVLKGNPGPLFSSSLPVAVSLLNSKLCVNVSTLRTEKSKLQLCKHGHL